MPFSPSLQKLIAARLAEARAKYPAALSSDGEALLVDGGIGYGAYVSPGGDIFLETYGIDEEPRPKIDRSAHARAMVAILGARHMPELVELIPPRPEDAVTCSKCSGKGWQHPVPGITYICQPCAGLGWSI